MGGAIAKNTATQIATVTNDVTNSVSGTAVASGTCVNRIRFKSCVVDGSVNASQACQTSAVSKQIEKLVANNNLKSDVSQKLAQIATTKVGAAGIGYADAQNYASALANVGNQVSNIVSSVAVQTSNSVSDFNCDHSVIRGSVTIGQLASANFMQQQTLENDATTAIANTISQDITQKATAEVAGIGMIIVFIVLVVCGVGYFTFKPYEMILQNKYIMTTAIGSIGLLFMTIMFMLKCPPFFSDVEACRASQQDHCSSPDSACVDCKEDATVTIKAPPQRYLWSVFGRGDVTLGQPTTDFTPGLYQAVIQLCGGWGVKADVGGTDYRPGTQDEFMRRLGEFAKHHPKYADYPRFFEKNPIVTARDGAPANPGDYFLKTNLAELRTKLLNAAAGSPWSYPGLRFVLCSLLQIDTSVGITGEDVTPNANGQTFEFVPEQPAAPQDATVTGGVVKGRFGTLVNTSYRYKKFMKSIGGYLLGGLVGLFALQLLFHERQVKNSANNNNNVDVDVDAPQQAAAAAAAAE
jgi:hypothetical protein